MENKGYPRTKEIQDFKQLTVYIDCQKSVISESILKRILQNVHIIEFVDQLEDAILLLTPHENSLEIYPVNNHIDLPSLKLPYSRNILEKLFTDYYKYFTNLLLLNSFFHPRHRAHKYNKTLSNFLKRINQNIRKNSNPGTVIIKQTIEQKKELALLLSNCQTIKDLPSNILKLGLFKNYQSCQILIHEKGNTTSENIIFNKSTGLTVNIIPITSFNKIHTIIKKSKSKLFNQTQLLDNNLGVIGTFLAREIGLTKHTIIIVLSRNDFLPASTNEQDYFQNLFKNMAPVLNDLLFEYLSKKKNKHLLLCLRNLNFPCEIINKKNKIIYFNNSKHFSRDYTNQVELDDHNILRYTPYHDSAQSSDLYHFQRISLLGELLNTLRHELNNPLFGMKLTADLMIDEGNTPDILEILSDISSNCERCQNIITNFSLLYKNQNISQELNLHDLLKETIILCKSETRGIEKQITFPNYLPPNNFIVKSNPTWITQIIFNFIINGAQSIKSVTNDLNNHKIIISVDRKSLNGISSLIISVSDSGPGINKNIQNKILKPFITTKHEGTGLGLSICTYLAGKLDGNINFTNHSPLPGATFQLELPINYSNTL